MPAAARPHEAEKRPDPRPMVPLRRLFLLTVVTAVIAFGLQALLAIAGAPAADAIRLLVVPPAAGAVIFLGLRPYPTAGRLRVALMVTVALFFVGLALG